MADANLSRSGMPRNAERGTFGKSPNRSIPIGTKFRRLTTIASPYVNGKNTMVECKCDCGESRIVRAAELTNGTAVGCKSCFTPMSDAAKERVRKAHIKHGMTGTVEYNLWLSMRSRCSDPKNMSYRDYGARGIKVCQKWVDNFPAFLADVGMRPSKAHTMDRIDVDGDYSPENCRWATRLEQARNTRVTLQVNFHGKMMGTAEVARALGVTPAHAWRKLKKQGISIEQFENTILSNRAKLPGKYKAKPPAPEWAAWKSAKSRCENPKNSAYKEYGGRGIRMSEEWSSSYEQFYADMGSKPIGMSLDRIDNEKGYSKENCRWASVEVQNRNRRNTQKYEFRGSLLTKAEIARALGINPSTVARYMARKGMTPDDLDKWFSRD